jgi:hypothetical protein
MRALSRRSYGRAACFLVRGGSLLGLIVLAPAVAPAGCGGATGDLSGDDASVEGGGGGDGGKDASGNDSGGPGDDSGVDGGADCNGMKCGQYRLCCAGQCVNPANDPLHCGKCSVQCAAPTSYCAGGQCEAPPCAPGSVCVATATCCGSQCCALGQLCCMDEGPVPAPEPTCYTPTPAQPTCPQGCAPMCKSDRNLKRGIQPVDDQAVLEGVARMPVSSWSYTSDDPSVRHLGPMAQDFHDAFGLGASDRAYDPIDAHGVAFAAIKALYERSSDQDARIERLERENAELRQSCGP